MYVLSFVEDLFEIFKFESQIRGAMFVKVKKWSDCTRQRQRGRGSRKMEIFLQTKGTQTKGEMPSPFASGAVYKDHH